MAMNAEELISEFISADGKTMAYGIDTVMKSIRPCAKFVLDGTQFISWKDSTELPPPTWKEVEEELARQEKIAKYYQYVYDRSSEFPEGYKQLDMLWDDIDSGKPLKEGKWYNTIKEIKEKYPKPEGSAPE
jgi:hypothetical protein